MIYYRGGKVSWGDYLLDKSVNDLQKTISTQNTAIQKSLLEQNHSLIISNERLSQKLDDGLWSIENRLSQIHGSINDFHSDFNYAMTLLIDRVEVLQDSFRTMIQQLDHIHETLKHPLLTKAAELREIAFDRLEKGLLDKALEAFLESDSIYDTDFIVQIQIGKLYLYGKDEDVDLINLLKAKQYLINAARYAKAEATKIPEASMKAAEAYFHASIAAYILSNEANGKDHQSETNTLTEEALNLANKAISLWPDFDQAHYHKAKYAALLLEENQLLEGLEKAVISDKRYVLKAWVDNDFSQVKNLVDNLITKLRDTYQNDCVKKLQSLKDLFNSMVEWRIKDSLITNAITKIKKIDELLSTKSYLDIQEALEILSPNLFQGFTEELNRVKHELITEENNLLAKTQQLVEKLETGLLLKFIDRKNFESHRAKISNYRKASLSYDSLTKSINTLLQELKWFEDIVSVAENKKSDKYDRKLQRKRRRDSLLISLSNLAAFGLPIIGSVLLFKNFQELEKYMNSWMIMYSTSAIVLGGMFIAVFFKGFVTPEVWGKFFMMFGLCAISPIIYFLVLLAGFLILLIPAAIAAILGSNMFEQIFKWGATGGYLLMSLVEWIICFKLLHSEN